MSRDQGEDRREKRVKEREKEREMTGGKEAPNERGGTGKKKRCWFFIAKRERAERKRERESEAGNSAQPCQSLRGTH